MAMLAMWFQETDVVSTLNTKLLVTFLGVVALAMAALAIALIVLAAKSVKAIKGLVETVDELKEKALPLIRQPRSAGCQSLCCAKTRPR